MNIKNIVNKSTKSKYQFKIFKPFHDAVPAFHLDLSIVGFSSRMIPSSVNLLVGVRTLKTSLPPSLPDAVIKGKGFAEL